MKEGLLLLLKLKSEKKARTLNQVIPVVLGSTLHYLPIILKFVGLQDVASGIFLERIIIHRLLIIPFRVVVLRAHPSIGQGALFINVTPESLNTLISLL